MAELTMYKGLKVLNSTPSQAGGEAIQFDLKKLVDWSPLSEWARTGAPGTTNNQSQNFYPGSMWLQTDVSPPKLFVCQSSTDDTAVWQQVMTEIKIVNDTAPQLGGNLNVNGKSITSTSGSVVINPATQQTFFGATQTTQQRGLDINVESNAPGIILYDKSMAPAPPDDTRGWEIFASQGKLFCRLLKDDISDAKIWLEVQRNGYSITLIRITGLTQIDGPLYHRQTYCDNSRIDDAATITFNLATSDMHTTILVPAVSPDPPKGPRQLALSNIRIGQRFNVTISQATGSTGGQTVTWWNNISWPGNVVPTLTTTAGKKDVFEFLCTECPFGELPSCGGC